jgi:tetratricopeptide (TPR) repeat protein
MRYTFLSLVTVVLFSCVEPKPSSQAVMSMTELNQAILDSPDDIALIEQRLAHYVEEGNFKGAMKDAEFLYAQDSANVDLKLQYVEHAFRWAEEGEEPSYYRTALSLLDEESDLSTDWLNLRGRLRYLFKQHEGSLKDLNAVLKADPYVAEAYYLKALNRKEMGDTVAAVSLFQTAVEQAPDMLEAYEQMAVIFAAQNDPVSIHYYDNALSIDSSRINLWYGKGKFLQDQGQFAAAKKCYEAILRRDAFNQFAHYNLGYLYYAQEQYELAVDHFAEVIYTNPNYVYAFYARGLCFKELGNRAQAKYDFQNALKLDPDFEDAAQELQKMN